MTDVWGDIYKTQWSGHAASYEIERDDGRVDRFASAANYFESPEHHLEGELLRQLEGPVLDIAAGAGSHVLYLQSLGLDVVAGESSAGAREVCSARGCLHVMPIDLRAIQLDSSAFGSIIVMGNTIGAHQTLETFTTLLTMLRRAVRAHGRLLFTMIDPTDTHDPSHLAYQQRNRQHGRTEGLVRMRVRRHDVADDWMHLLMLPDDEVDRVTTSAGWTLVERRRRGPWRANLYQRAAG